MTDEQIIKAMQCVIGNVVSCSECEYRKAPLYPICRRMCAENALDLINRQKAKIEELRSDKIIAERHEKDARELFVGCTRQLEEAKAEIERLKKGVSFTFAIEDFESIKETIISNLDNKIKSEAIKEFAECLKSRLSKLSVRTKTHDGKTTSDYVDDIANQLLHDVVPQEIDNLVKEMTGAEKRK